MNNQFSAYLVSLGCPKNQVDGEMLMRKLCDSGFSVAQSEADADAIIVNTCGFIESAKAEAIEAILEAAEYKKAGLASAVIVTGCLAERYKDEIMNEMPEVDAVVGIGANSDIVKICQKALCGVTTNIFPNKCFLPLDDNRLVKKGSHWAYLKISDGCDNKCSYCAIPGIRGEYRERTLESITEEAESLAQKGIKEIILVAQDTTKYGISLYGKYMLPELLRRISDINGIEWIRIFYCYPDKVTDELIDAIASLDKVCSYIDIPLQHCNKDVLKAMNRSGSYDELKSLIVKMRSKIPGLSLRTTLMVGFPGETEEQFEELCKFVKEMKFDKMGCFKFSPEEDTPAYDMDNQIEEDVKARREEVLGDIQYTVTENANKSRIGKVYKTVVDDIDGEYYIGRSYLDSPEIDSGIIFSSPDKLNIGDFADVRITDYDGYDLIGETIR
ncbi:MAG: 30S ribosomal protein S12 methylthiotransferase RimO [Anaerotruncus sp.]|nr:30S ribosomal protein S12 methylthiotransferase RimO [Anaerotruncus sp.]